MSYIKCITYPLAMTKSDATAWMADPADYTCVVCGGQATALVGNMVVEECDRVGICDRCAVLLLHHPMDEARAHGRADGCAIRGSMRGRTPRSAILQEEELESPLAEALDLIPEDDGGAKGICVVAALMLCNACLLQRRLRDEPEMKTIVRLDKVAGAS